MPSTRPAIGQSLATPSTPARRLDRDDVTAREVACDLRAHGFAVHRVATERAGRTAMLTLRRLGAALADDRETAVLEHAELTDDAVAPALRAAAAGAEPEPVALDAQRVLELERLHRRRERVRHGDVHAARARGVGAGALPPAERLVVREPVVAER